MNVKAIGGLFETQIGVQQALHQLTMRGYEHYAYSIIGRAGDPPLPEGVGQSRGKGLFRALARLGLAGAQADYYVEGILHGSVLLVIHGVDSSHLSDIHTVLQGLGAKFPTRS